MYVKTSKQNWTATSHVPWNQEKNNDFQLKKAHMETMGQMQIIP